MSTAITLSQDLKLKSGTVPAGTVLDTNADALMKFWQGAKLCGTVTPTLSCQHPFFDGASVAVPSTHIVNSRDVLMRGRELSPFF